MASYERPFELTYLLSQNRCKVKGTTKSVYIYDYEIGTNVHGHWCSLVVGWVISDTRAEAVKVAEQEVAVCERALYRREQRAKLRKQAFKAYCQAGEPGGAA